MSYSVRFWAGVWALLAAFPLVACAQVGGGRVGACFSAGDWVGKYPADASVAHGKFLNLPCIKGSLQAILPEAEYKVLQAQLTVDSPIELAGNYLVVARCRAHNCPAQHAMIFIHAETADVIVGMYRRGAASSRTAWYSGNTDPLQLPRELLDRFLARHSPK